MLLKFTDSNLRTHNGACQWVPGEWQETDGSGGLCGPGWIHLYDGTPELAVCLDPIHGNFLEKPDAQLREVDIDGQRKEDHGLKLGTTRCRLLERIAIPEVSIPARVRWAIYCVRAIPDRQPILRWKSWADKWLAGEREVEAAAAAAWAARAARAAAAAAEAARAARATTAVAWAAEAAAWAARATTAEAKARAAAAERLPLAELLAKAIADEEVMERP